MTLVDFFGIALIFFACGFIVRGVMEGQGG